MTLFQQFLATFNPMRYSELKALGVEKMLKYIAFYSFVISLIGSLFVFLFAGPIALEAGLGLGKVFLLSFVTLITSFIRMMIKIALFSLTYGLIVKLLTYILGVRESYGNIVFLSAYAFCSSFFLHMILNSLLVGFPKLKLVLVDISMPVTIGIYIIPIIFLGIYLKRK